MRSRLSEKMKNRERSRRLRGLLRGFLGIITRTGIITRCWIAFPAWSIDLLLPFQCPVERIDIRAEFDDFPQQVRRLSLKVGHRLGRVLMSRRERQDHCGPAFIVPLEFILGLFDVLLQRLELVFFGQVRGHHALLRRRPVADVDPIRRQFWSRHLMINRAPNGALNAGSCRRRR